jgi:hypothetical protein
MKKVIILAAAIFAITLVFIVNQSFAGLFSPVGNTKLKTLNSKETNTKTSIGIPSPTICVNPGDDIQALVEANPPGTTFILRAGIHRFTTQLY